MSDVQNLIIETATRLFEDYCTPEILRQAEQGVWPAELWTKVEETGLPLASIPEEAGGAGGNLSDAIAVLRVAGQFGVPLPLAETYLAWWLAAGAGLTLSTEPVAVVFTQAGTEPRFSQQDGGWTVSGTVARVGWARHAKQLLVLGQSENGLYLGLVQPENATLKQGQNLAGEPRDTISFANAEATQVVRAAHTIDWVWSRMAMLRAAQMVGALEAISQRTIRYASERIQFGRALNQFQAIQQQLAVMVAEVMAARISMEAAMTVAETSEATAAIAAAKIRVGEAAGQATAIAHQVHGAMGYTYEYPLHFLTKRLWAWRDEFGSESEWARWLGQQVATAGADALWPFLTA